MSLSAATAESWHISRAEGCRPSWLERPDDQIQQDREDHRGEEGEDEAAGEEVDLGVDVAAAEGQRAAAGGGGGALAVLADCVDDAHCADQGEEQAGAGVAVED